MTPEGGSGPGRRGKKVRVDLRRNRSKPRRDKGAWTRLHGADDARQDETVSIESVRAKGALSRKRTVVIPDDPSAAGPRRPGVVVAMRGLIAEVDDGERLWACTIRRKLRTRKIDERQALVVGDRVEFSPMAAADGQARAVVESRELPEGVIESAAGRATMLQRRYESRVQVIAANVDVVVIVVSADQPTLRPHLIDRYLVAVHQGDMRPVICVNKMDFDVDGHAAEVVERYAAIGYRAIPTCVPRQDGLDALRDELRGRTSVVVGPSGVGKSSLLNAMDEGLALKIGGLTDLQRGRHTTTTARLLRWAFGGYVVDTPGLRQFDLADLESKEVEAYFVEFRGRIAECRFPSCTHVHEDGCAIRAAVEAEAIHPERYDSYCRIHAECREKERF